VPDGAVAESIVIKVRNMSGAVTLPPTGPGGHRAAGKIVEVRMERDGQEERDLVLEKAMEVRMVVTPELLDAAAGDPRTITVQQKDPVTGRWESLSTRIDEATGEIIAETTRVGALVATVPGPPPRAGEALTVVNPTQETVLAPPPTPGAPPPPVLVAKPGTTQEIVALLYAPRAPQQLLPASPGQTFVGQPFELDAYHLGQALADYRFSEPMDYFVPFSQEMLDQVGGDASQFTLRFYDENASPPQWVALPTEVIQDGLYVPLAHLSLFSLTVPEGAIVGGVPVDIPSIPHTAALFLSSLYDKSIPLTQGDVASVDLMVDSGGFHIGHVEATILYPEDLLEVTGVEIAGSICDQWPSPPLQEPGRILVRCDISGDGYDGHSALVANLTMRAKGSGLPTISFAPESRVTTATEGLDILGYMPQMALSINREVPVVVYPEPVVPTLVEKGISLLMIAIAAASGIAMVLIAVGLALMVLRRRYARVDSTLRALAPMVLRRRYVRAVDSTFEGAPDEDVLDEETADEGDTDEETPPPT